MHYLKCRAGTLNIEGYRSVISAIKRTSYGNSKPLLTISHKYDSPWQVIFVEKCSVQVCSSKEYRNGCIITIVQEYGRTLLVTNRSP